MVSKKRRIELVLGGVALIATLTVIVVSLGLGYFNNVAGCLVTFFAAFSLRFFIGLKRAKLTFQLKKREKQIFLVTTTIALLLTVGLQIVTLNGAVIFGRYSATFVIYIFLVGSVLLLLLSLYAVLKGQDVMFCVAVQSIGLLSATASYLHLMISVTVIDYLSQFIIYPAWLSIIILIAYFIGVKNKSSLKGKIKI